MRVVTFGELMLKLSAPGYTRLFQTPELDVLFCGSEANVAVSLAQFGMDSAFVTKLPDNDVGKAALRSLRSFGVDCSRIPFGEGRMGVYYAEKGASQRGSKVIYDRAGSAIALAAPGDFDWEAIFDGADWFHWSGITPALSDSAAKITLEGCRTAKRMGLTVSCDLNYRKKLWLPDKAQTVMSELVSYADVCVANEEDADKCLGIKAENTDVELARLDADAYRQVAKAIHKRFGCSKVAVTLRESYSASRNGWSGLLYDAATDEVLTSRKYQLDIVDRVGGGDSFSAGLIYGLCSGMPDQEALEFAVAASCLKHSIEGDFNLVGVDEVQALMCGSGNGRVQR